MDIVGAYDCQTLGTIQEGRISHLVKRDFMKVMSEST